MFSGHSAYTRMRDLLSKLVQGNLIKAPEKWSLSSKEEGGLRVDISLRSSDFPECSIHLSVWTVYEGARDVLGHTKGVEANIQVPTFTDKNFKSLIKTPNKVGTAIQDPLGPIHEIEKKVNSIVEKAVKSIEAYMLKYEEMKRKREDQRNSWEKRLEGLGEIPDRVKVSECGSLLQLCLYVTDSDAKEVLDFLRSLKHMHEGEK